MATLEVRPGLSIDIQTVPASAYIKFTLPDSLPVMFNPADATFRPFRDEPPVEEILSSISDEDRARVVQRLLRHARERLVGFAEARAPKRRLKPHYKETVFEQADDKPGEYWLITAYNPSGRLAEENANKAADNKLLAEINELGFKPFRIIGHSKRGSHAEPGWGVECDAGTAIRLGSQFHQEAVFHFTGGEIWLVDCASCERTYVDQQSARIIEPGKHRHFTLFVGSPEGSETIDGESLKAIRSCLASWFEGFTIQKAEGCFKSRPEESVLIHLATDKPRDVIAVAEEIRVLLKQEGVGISHNGIYQRVRVESDGGLILESLGIAEKPKDAWFKFTPTSYTGFRNDLS